MNHPGQSIHPSLTRKSITELNRLYFGCLPDKSGGSMWLPARWPVQGCSMAALGFTRDALELYRVCDLICICANIGGWEIKGICE